MSNSMDRIRWDVSFSKHHFCLFTAHGCAIIKAGQYTISITCLYVYGVPEITYNDYLSYSNKKLNQVNIFICTLQRNNN